MYNLEEMKMARPRLENLKKIFLSSLTSVIPKNLIRNSLNYNPATEQLNILGHNFMLKNKNVYIIGTGKAVKNMALEVENILKSKIGSGILSVPVGSITNDTKNSQIVYMEGAKNNLPDEDAQNTSFKIKSLVSNLTENDFLLVLISGGGSALLPLPKKPITLEEKTSLIKKLANAGADITEINTVRKRISDLKGGQLAIKAQPAQVVSLILSDIVADPLDLIASGPTVENTDEKTAALDVINKYNSFKNLPHSIVQVLETDEKDTSFPHSNVDNIIIGSNKLCIETAKLEAENIGYFPINLSHTITGNVNYVAKKYIKMTKLFCDYLSKKIDLNTLAHELKSIDLPLNVNNINVSDKIYNKELCLILGGETTVEVIGSGIGGRNQQLALEFSLLLHENKDIFNGYNIEFLSAGTDGIDGPTDAAGAIGYSNLVTDSLKENIDIETYLKNNDSYNFYKRFNNGELHVITGHTNTNVMDIHLILITKL